GGARGLIYHPGVAAIAGGADGRQDRVEQSGEGVQHSRPGPMSEPLAQFPSDVDALDVHYSVVVTEIADVAAVQLARQPLAAVHVHLDLIGGPPLESDWHGP